MQAKAFVSNRYVKRTFQVGKGYVEQQPESDLRSCWIKLDETNAAKVGFRAVAHNYSRVA